MDELAKKPKTDAEKAGILERLSKNGNDKIRQLWLKKEGMSYDYSMGDQLTYLEQKALEDAGMPTFTINMITPQVRLIKYFLTANNPRWNAVGNDGSDIDIAHVFSTMIEYFWYISKGGLQYSQIVDNCLRRGVGYFHLYHDLNADQGMGDIKFESLDTRYVIVDPASRDPLFTDASWMMIEIHKPRYKMVQELPQYVNKILKASGEKQNYDYSERDRVSSNTVQEYDYDISVDPDSGGSDNDIIPYRKCYRKIRVPFVKVFMKIPPTEEQIKEIEKIVKIRTQEISRELSVQVKEKKLQLDAKLNLPPEEGGIIKERYELEIENLAKWAEETKEQQINKIKSKLIDNASKVEVEIMPKKEYDKLQKSEGIKENVVFDKEYNETRINVQCAYGDQLLYDKNLNIKEYPIIPLCFEHTGTVFPMSAVRPLVGKQQEINKAHQIMIHNANIGSNVRWLAKQGLITNKQQWRKDSSAAGAVLEYVDHGDGSAPTPVQPMALNNAFFSVVQSGKEDLEYTSLVNSSMMGDAQKQPEPYRGMLANDEFGSRQVKSWMNNVLHPVLEHVGLVYQEMSQDFYQSHKVFRIVQPGAEGDLDVKMAEINTPIYGDYSKAIGKFKDYSAIRFDVKLIAGSTMPVNRWALFDEYMRMYEAGFLTKRFMIAEADIKNKQQLMKDMDDIAQRDQLIKQQEKEIKSLEGDKQTLRRQVLQAELKGDIDSISVELQKELGKTHINQETNRQKMNLATDKAIEKINEKDSE